VHSSPEAAHHWTKPTVQEGNPRTSFRNQVSVVVLNPYQIRGLLSSRTEETATFRNVKTSVPILGLFGSGFFHHQGKKK
jgi:hypothetical protein